MQITDFTEVLLRTGRDDGRALQIINRRDIVPFNSWSCNSIPSLHACEKGRTMSIDDGSKSAWKRISFVSRNLGEKCSVVENRRVAGRKTGESRDSSATSDRFSAFRKPCGVDGTPRHDLLSRPPFSRPNRSLWQRT